MAIITRATKGSELDHTELDNNFTELESRIENKANVSHTHTIAQVAGLQTELDNKIDMEDTNEPDGLLRLNSQGKVPCEFLNDCFDVASKVSSDDLFDGVGLIKTALLPSGSGGGGSNCDCQNIETNIANLEDNKANKLKIVRRVAVNGEFLTTDEEIIIINDLIDSFDISQNLIEGRVIKLGRIGGEDIELSSIVNFRYSSEGHVWKREAPNAIELVCSENSWYQIA